MSEHYLFKGKSRFYSGGGGGWRLDREQDSVPILRDNFTSISFPHILLSTFMYICVIISNGLLFQAMFYMSNTKEIHFTYQRVKVKALKCFRYLVYIEKSFAYYFHEALWQTLSCVMTSSLPKLKIQYLIKYLNDLKSSLVSKYYTYCNFYKLTKGATRGARGLKPPP